MENKPYRTLYKGGVGEIVEKKSRFIATVRNIETEEEALSVIADLKKQYWDASHNCYAFVAGRNQELQRCSDDGEPNGTAGRPMLEVLLREDIHNLVVVVTRYFGGILLGTGGLLRAYQKAVREGLANSTIIEKRAGQLLEVHTDYNGIGKIQYIAAQRNIFAAETEYTDKVLVKLMVPSEKLEEFKKAVTEGTSGTARYQGGETVEFAEIDGKIKIF